MSDNKKQWVAYIIVVVAVVVAGVLGVVYPMPEPPAVDFATRGDSHFSGIAIEATAVTVGSDVFAATDPLTITGVLTDVVLLYEQQ